MSVFVVLSISCHDKRFSPSRVQVRAEITGHYVKLKATRQTFTLGAKINSFLEVFDLFVQVERVLDI